MSLSFVLILLFVCASNLFFGFCVLILIFFSIHTNTGWFVSFHFISFETSITIVLHVIKMLVFHHTFHRDLNGWDLYSTKTSSWFYIYELFSFVFLLVRFIYTLLCGSDVENGQQIVFFFWCNITK